MKFFLYFTIIYVCLNTDFKKNSGILNSKRFRSPRLKEIDNLNIILEKIDSGSNMLILFYADWCHHCKEFLPKFQTASQYEFSEDFEFFSVNCKNKDICDKFTVNKFPTTKVYVKGKELSEEPPRDLEALLEFVDKIKSPPIIKLEESAIRHFSNNYGEVSFLILEEEENSSFYNCVKNLAEDEYLPLLYFGHLKRSTHKLENGKVLHSPSIITLGSNAQFNLHLEGKNREITCKEIKDFIGINKYPLLKRLNMNFIRRLQAEKKILIVTAIESSSSQNMHFLHNTIKKIALENRNYVFSFLDYDEDKDILSHLRVSKSENPVVIIYNFKIRRFYVDPFVYTNNEIENTNNLSNLINKLNNNELRFSAGNWIEDFLESIGIQINHTTIIAMVVGSFGILCIVFMIMIFYCGDKNEEVEAQELTNKQIQNISGEKQETENKKDK